MTNDDTRCCGTGTCMINADGLCWCGQRWNGEQMCPPERQQALSGQMQPAANPAEKQASAPDA